MCRTSAFVYTDDYQCNVCFFTKGELTGMDLHWHQKPGPGKTLYANGLMCSTVISERCILLD